MTTEGKVKVLWVSDGEAPTGFARVAHSVIKYLDQKKYDIHHLAVNYRGDPHDNWWKLYPAMWGGAMTPVGPDLLGFGRFSRLIDEIKPDLIFMLNDPWVLQKYLALIIESKGLIPGVETIPVVTYFPVDATEHDPEWFRDYEELVRACCVYTKFAKNVILDTGAVNPTRIEVIPHGIDKDIFYPIDKNEARKEIFPLNEKPEFLNSFIILNANRNQPRKRIDITIRAFRDFARDKPENVKLYLHMGTRDMGWDIIRMASRYGIDDRIAISSLNTTLANVPDERLNQIYNACDIGINTGLGEGWGLTSWEHAATGKPQIVPDHSALPEIWGDSGIYIPTIADYVYEGTLTVARIVSTEGVVEKLEWAYQDWKSGGKELKRLGDMAYKIVSAPKHKWQNIAKKFDKVFDKVRNIHDNNLAE